MKAFLALAAVASLIFLSIYFLDSADKTVAEISKQTEIQGGDPLLDSLPPKDIYRLTVKSVQPEIKLFGWLIMSLLVVAVAASSVKVERNTTRDILDRFYCQMREKSLAIRQSEAFKKKQLKQSLEDKLRRDEESLKKDSEFSKFMKKFDQRLDSWLARLKDDKYRS